MSSLIKRSRDAGVKYPQKQAQMRAGMCGTWGVPSGAPAFSVRCVYTCVCAWGTMCVGYKLWKHTCWCRNQEQTRNKLPAGGTPRDAARNAQPKRRGSNDTLVLQSVGAHEGNAEERTRDTEQVHHALPSVLASCFVSSAGAAASTTRGAAGVSAEVVSTVACFASPSAAAPCSCSSSVPSSCVSSSFSQPNVTRPDGA